MSDYCTSCERLCVHCVYGIYSCIYSCIYSFADDTLSAHGTLSVLQMAHFVHTVYCVLYKRKVLA